MNKNYCGFTTTVNGGKGGIGKRGKSQTKINDIQNITSVSSTGSILTGLSGPGQGVALNQRTGDIIYLDKMYLTYTCDSANSDVFASLRVIIFQWRPNSALVMPAVNDILQNSGFNVCSMYDWNYSNQYTILYDRLHTFAGTSTAPTASTNQCWSGEISLASCQRRSQFQLATTLGSNQLYCLVISDSAVIPFPNFTMVSRVTYTED